MFFSEALHLLGSSKNYTLENAHDQVQAIRLMHYETNSKEKLLTFIEECKTFESAYAHLQNLARDRVKKVSS
jgi:helix-turn-helix protein